MACFKKVTVFLADGTKFSTDINKNLSNKEIKDYYLRAGYLDMGGIRVDKQGSEYELEKPVKIKKVVVSKKLSCY